MVPDSIKFEQDDLTAKQSDYAVFLPAISSFYAGYIGRERHGVGLETGRLPANIGDMEAMNWLNPQKALFPYKYSLYSAGHANLDLNKFDAKEDMVRNRDPNTIMLADSGGFQIAKGVWEGRWADPTDKAAEKKREAVLKWQMGIATHGLTMDIPTWTFRDPKAAAASGIYSYEDAIKASKYNNEYWIANRYGDTKILNVLQGGNHAEADHWYSIVKDYCNPSKYKNHFNGWGMGGQNMCDVHLVLKRLIHLIHDGLLEKGVHDWMHFLGTSKLEWACLLTDIQRAIRKYHNSNFTISFDCASPFLATANGQIYTQLRTEDRGKWSYMMSPTADDKKYATDTRSFRDAVLQDSIHDVFEDSPISSRMSINDICIYKPGDLNKIGKEGKTSWDSFSYAIMMGHNVWHHIRAVQEANRQYDAGILPGMLVREQFDIVKFRDLVDQIFSLKDRAKSIELINNNSRFWDQIIGTRGFTGKKTTNSQTQFNILFEIEDEEPPVEEFDESKLDELETGNV
jgi:hypothetical protein